MLCDAQISKPKNSKTKTNENPQGASKALFRVKGFHFILHLSHHHLLVLGGVHIRVCLLFEDDAADSPVEFVDMVGLLSAGLP